MPVGARKNQLYRLALPLFGLPCTWREVHVSGAGDFPTAARLKRVFRRHRVVGGCVQCIRGGQLAETYYVGQARLRPLEPVATETLFRTASIAKMACALLVMRLHSLGKLDLMEDISALWGAPIRNPHHPEVPIPLAALLGHTSGLMDSPLYFQSYAQSVTVDAILADGACFSQRLPFERFRYSNFAAGLVGCLLEKRFGESLESLAQRELFAPLGVRATFDLRTLASTPPASSYRVLPAAFTPAFDASARLRTAPALDVPDPQAHFLLASGSLFITAAGLATLCLPLIHGGLRQGKPFLTPDSVARMCTPTTEWPEPEVRMRHGMGLLEVNDPAIFPHRLLGHQGFAYGAVNGVFFDEHGNGFASLNSGASELRLGHLSCLNRDLIRVCLQEDR